ncbi:MAG: peptide chain release factor 3, partial [Alphaproteobacteria bacterium]|nr:peptide chain release factor 3 [Alphaproteobacteria bacterium]
IESEYGIKAGLEAAPCETARWIDAADPALLKRFQESNRSSMAVDRDGSPVFMARNAWEINYIGDKWPDVRFTATREMV